MSKRIIYIGSPAELRFKDEQLLISLHTTGTVESIPIEDIAAIELDSGQIMLSNFALARLALAGVAAITSDECHVPAGVLLPFS